MQNTCCSKRKKHLKMSTANMSYRLYMYKSRSTPVSSHTDEQFCKVFLKAAWLLLQMSYNITLITSLKHPTILGFP